MAIVIDANLLVALVTQHPQRQVVYQQFEDWAEQNARLHTSGLFERSRVQPVCEELARLPIQSHTVGFDPEVVEMALTLGRKSAYDAVYLVLAQRLGAELWTLDSPLYRNAVGEGYPVHLLGAVGEK